MIAAALAASLAAAPAAEPRPAELETFADWTVGCDNGRACHAVALIPEDWPENGTTMSVRRGPEAGAPPVIAFDAHEHDGVAGLAADGERLDLRLGVDRDGMLVVAASDTPAVIAALRRASRIELRKADGTAAGKVSLKGASAALLYMDDRQGRVGTVTALARPGKAPASTVPPPPGLPKVLAAPPGAGKGVSGAAASPGEIAALRKRFGCELEEVGGPDEQEAHPLGQGALVLLACGSGAYNVSMVPILVGPRGGAADARAAPFDASEPWWEGEGKPMLVNAGFDPATGLLSSFAKGRGLADCGVGRDYVWDGARFRLVAQVEMSACRGSRDYISTWRAEVVRR
jgi:hypothetical protein